MRGATVTLPNVTGAVPKRIFQPNSNAVARNRHPRNHPHCGIGDLGFTQSLLPAKGNVLPSCALQGSTELEIKSPV